MRKNVSLFKKLNINQIKHKTMPSKEADLIDNQSEIKYQIK